MKFLWSDGSYFVANAKPAIVETNQAYCFKCKTFLDSKNENDFVECKCGYYIDGGLQYPKSSEPSSCFRLFKKIKKVRDFNKKLPSYNHCVSISVNEPWYTLISNKRKTIEGRLNKFGIETIKKGDLIHVQNRNNLKQSLLVVVKDRKHYDNIESYLENCLTKSLPINRMTIEKGIVVYRQYISEKTEKKMGIEAIEIELLEI